MSYNEPKGEKEIIMKENLEMLNKWRTSVSEESMEAYTDMYVTGIGLTHLEVGYLGYIDQLEVLMELISDDSSDVELELLQAEANDIHLKMVTTERLIQKTTYLMSKDEE